MTVDDLRSLPAFMQAWPSCRDALMEFLNRRLLASSADNSQESGTQTLARLIQELEKLDVEPKPLRSPRGLKPLHSMQTPKP